MGDGNFSPPTRQRGRGDHDGACVYGFILASEYDLSACTRARVLVTSRPTGRRHQAPAGARTASPPDSRRAAIKAHSQAVERFKTLGWSSAHEVCDLLPTILRV